MPTVDVPGVGPVDFPEGMSNADMGAAINRSFPNLAKYRGTTFPVQLGKEGEQASMRQEVATRSGPEQALAGVGTAVNDAAMRLKQLVTGNLTPQEQGDVQSGRTLRGASVPALAGGVAGQAAMTYPIRTASLLGNAALGAGMGGLMEPVLPGESTVGNIKSGAAGGALGYGAVRGLGALAQPIAQSAPVQSLVQSGVIPTIGQSARSSGGIIGRTVGGIEDAATSIPLLGDIIKGSRGRAVNEVQRAALARATPAGTVPTTGIGRGAIDRAGDAVSDAYDTALNRIGTVTVDQTFNAAPQRIIQGAAALNTVQRGDVQNLVDEVIRQRIGQGGTLSADTAKLIDSDLGSYVRDYSSSSVASERRMAGVVQNIQKEWRDLITRNAPDPQTAAQLQDANRAFANLRRVEQASIKAPTGGGEFTPAQLSQSVREMTPNKRTFARGNALMQDLSDPAAQVLTGRLGESGTVPRGILAMGLAGGGGAALNEKYGGPDWATRAMLAAALMGPLYSRAGSRYAIGDLLPMLQQPIASAATAAAPIGGILGRSTTLQQP